MSLLPHRVRSIILAERGANWAFWTDYFRNHSVGTTVVVQRPGERLDAFARRAVARVNGLALGDDGVPTHTVVVGGGRIDPVAVRARSTLVRKLAASLRGPGGVLRLESAGPDRHAMAAIAATVSLMTRGTGVKIEHAGSTPAAA